MFGFRTPQCPGIRLSSYFPWRVTVTKSEYQVSEEFSLEVKIEMPCPECGATLRVPSEYFGGVGCPDCEHRFVIPRKEIPNPPKDVVDMVVEETAKAVGYILLRVIGSFVAIILLLWYECSRFG